MEKCQKQSIHPRKMEMLTLRFNLMWASFDEPKALRLQNASMGKLHSGQWEKASRLFSHPALRDLYVHALLRAWNEAVSDDDACHVMRAIAGTEVRASSSWTKLYSVFVGLASARDSVQNRLLKSTYFLRIDFPTETLINCKFIAVVSC